MNKILLIGGAAALAAWWWYKNQQPAVTTPPAAGVLKPASSGGFLNTIQTGAEEAANTIGNQLQQIGYSLSSNPTAPSTPAVQQVVSNVAQDPQVAYNPGNLTVLPPALQTQQLLPPVTTQDIGQSVEDEAPPVRVVSAAPVIAPPVAAASAPASSYATPMSLSRASVAFS